MLVIHANATVPWQDFGFEVAFCSEIGKTSHLRADIVPCHALPAISMPIFCQEASGLTEEYLRGIVQVAVPPVVSEVATRSSPNRTAS